MSTTPLNPHTLATWAQAQGWSVATSPDLPGQLLIQNAFGAPVPVRVAFFDRPTVVWLQVELSQVVVPERFAEVSLALALLNAATHIGSWNLKTSTGKVNFRLSVPTGNVGYAPSDLRFLFEVVLVSVQQSAPRLTQVLLGTLPADQVRPQ